MAAGDRDTNTNDKKRGKEKTKEPSLAVLSAYVGSGEATLRNESIVDGSGKHVVAPGIVTDVASERKHSSSSHSAVSAAPNLTDIMNVLSTIREEQSSQATKLTSVTDRVDEMYFGPGPTDHEQYYEEEVVFPDTDLPCAQVPDQRKRGLDEASFDSENNEFGGTLPQQEPPNKKADDGWTSMFTNIGLKYKIKDKVDGVGR